MNSSLRCSLILALFVSTLAFAGDPPAFEPGAASGTVESPELNEISGLVASRTHPGVLWVHNDSGDTARVFAMSSKGKHLGTFQLAGASAQDWEDIAIGPGPEERKSYLYCGDVGDDPSKRPGIVIYRVEEPAVKTDQAPVSETLRKVESFPLTYPDGAHNCETLLVDPENGDIYLVAKAPDGVSGVYHKPAPHKDGEAATLKRVATLTFGKAPLAGTTLTTGGDISPDGSLIAIRTYTGAFAWQRDKGKTVAEALAGTPSSLPVVMEKQGEALGFAQDGMGYFTVSEGLNPDLHFFGRKK